MIIREAVTYSDSAQILLKIRLQFSAMTTSTTTDAIALKFFLDTMQLLNNQQC